VLLLRQSNNPRLKSDKKMTVVTKAIEIRLVVGYAGNTVYA